MSAFLRELRDFWRFFKLSADKKRIVLYSEQSSYYAYFEGLIGELIKKGHPICYITSDRNDPILQTKDEMITPLYIKNLLSFFMPLIDCKVMVMTLTDLGNYHLKRSKNQVHYVYVFHALVSTHMVYSENAFDNYDSVLCVGPHHVKEIRRREEVHGLKPKKLVEAGYYRLERIFQNFKLYHKDGVKKTVLIAPSWGRGNIIESCGKRLIRALLQAGFEVILRPHPETLKRSPDTIKDIESEFNNHSDFMVERSVRTDDSLFKADVLISDYSGIALEYALGTERPVIFIDVPPKVHNAKFNELDLEPLELYLRARLGRVVSPDQVESVPDTVSALLSATEFYKKAVIEIRDKNVFNFGKSSEIGAQYIFELL